MPCLRNPKKQLRYDIEMLDMQRGIRLDGNVAPQDMPQFVNYV